MDYINELQGGGPYGDNATAAVLIAKLRKVATTVAGPRRRHRLPICSGIGLVRSVSFIQRYAEDPKLIFTQSRCLRSWSRRER